MRAYRINGGHRRGPAAPHGGPEASRLVCGSSPRPAGWLEAGWTFPADWPRTGLREARRLPLFRDCRVWI